MSLSGVAVPRATEPKTRSRAIPYRAHTSARRASSIVTPGTVGMSPRVAIDRRRPAATRAVGRATIRAGRSVERTWSENPDRRTTQQARAALDVLVGLRPRE